MTTKQFFIPVVLIIFFSLMLLGNDASNKNSKTTPQKHDMTKMMGRPTVDTVVEGLHLKIWMMTQQQHKQIMNSMKKMNHDSMKMDKETKESMMNGTHHIMVAAINAADGKELVNATAKIEIDSPSKIKSFIDLKPMMKHFGENLVLKEKGDYRITVSVNVDGFSREKEFKYKVL